MKLLVIFVALMALAVARPAKNKAWQFRKQFGHLPVPAKSTGTGVVTIEQIHDLVGEELKEAIQTLRERIQTVLQNVEAADPETFDMTNVETLMINAANSVNPTMVTALANLINRIFNSGIEGQAGSNCAGGCTGAITAAFAAASQELAAADPNPAACANMPPPNTAVTGPGEFLSYLKKALPCLAHNIDRLPEFVDMTDEDMGSTEVTTPIMEGILVKIQVLTQIILDSISQTYGPVQNLFPSGRLAKTMKKHPYGTAAGKEQRFWGMVSGVVAVGTVFGWWG